MTLLGKIFTVLIFIMSVAFCILAVVTFATHKNWKELAEARKVIIEQQEAKLVAQQAETEKAKGELAVEQAGRRSTLGTLQVKLSLLLADLDNNSKVLRDQTSALTVQTQAAKVAEDSLAAITAENGKIRNELRLAQQERDQTYLKSVSLNDKLNQAESLRERLEELNRQLQDQYAELNRVATALGFTKDTLVSQIPPKLDGVVTAVDEAKGLVEVSLGADDGLKRGHVLQIVRGDKYLGQIILREVGPDKAVGDIDKKMQRGRIKKDDNVTTKLVSPPLEKQRTNIFTMMLILSFLALVTGSIILSLEWKKFEGDAPWSTSAVNPKAAPQLATTPQPSATPQPGTTP